MKVFKNYFTLVSQLLAFNKQYRVRMAPMRGERGGSPARGARASLPLPRRLIRQIARHVASSGRSLRRLEVSGRVIDNFDDIEDASDESDMELAQPAVACGGNAGNLPPADHDDDLTSLSWLQDKNLLRGINLTKSDMEDTKMADNQIVVKRDTKTPPPIARVPSPPRTPCKAPPSPPANTHTKPPYSFSCLIFMAIEAAPARALPVKEIYAWIVRHFPYFRHAPLRVRSAPIPVAGEVGGVGEAGEAGEGEAAERGASPAACVWAPLAAPARAPRYRPRHRSPEVGPAGSPKFGGVCALRGGDLVISRCARTSTVSGGEERGPRPRAPLNLARRALRARAQ
ncbi:unnamed protein product [Arctia plantaginis]|uniref:Fork-head domain-containing protein n=1 Tax=Arctia plantaginis TaxID=874455 RepID=A0A8S1AQB4_ARCPL|nr:unnamed protein product [Arctia plantaginis]